MAEETETKQLFSPSDVSLHASRKDCWVVIHGKVRLVTDRTGNLSSVFRFRRSGSVS